MSLDNQEQLDAELAASEAEAEAEDIAISRQESLIEQLNQVRDETLTQLEENKNEVQEDIDGIKADIILPKWSTAPKIILAAGSVIRPESTVMNIASTVGGGAVTLTSNPSIADGINGLLVPPKNAGALRDAILDLVSRKDRGASLGRTLQSLTSRYTLRRMTQETVQAYQH